MKLCVFDFDNTLFRSPITPPNWKSNWWDKLVSLEPPVVPEKPDISWWNEQLLDKVKELSSNDDCYVILLTGRVEKTFKNRVFQLLEQVGIKNYFNFIGLNNKGDTLTAKKDYMSKFLDKDPRIDVVEFWDDRKIHREPFKQWAEQNKLEFIHHLVEIQTKEPEALP